jgi:hypothetical protein
VTHDYDIDPTREELLSLAPLVDACEPSHLESSLWRIIEDQRHAIDELQQDRQREFSRGFWSNILLAVLLIAELLWCGIRFSARS